MASASSTVQAVGQRRTPGTGRDLLGGRDLMQIGPFGPPGPSRLRHTVISGVGPPRRRIRRCPARGPEVVVLAGVADPQAVAQALAQEEVVGLVQKVLGRHVT